MRFQQRQTSPKRLPEIAQANMLVAFEFAQRLAQMKSPLEVPSVLSELMVKLLRWFGISLFAISDKS